ncbi:hypothetical protein GIB67_036971 [Kingdonia uniflora]|uniref:Uncharacterized protein n=1 Tax=Kingdonia uniflora TaxID=39325 RepID=A0A7J7NW34_9MAGN|nr:hypothetical protein GIB67_036971 [Kingdonia uniflora]
MVAEHTAPNESLNTSFEEIDEIQEAYGRDHSQVSPYELERRLHEVLQARQKERIQELESALECAEHKLHQKEMEVTWWKNVAQHN